MNDFYDKIIGKFGENNQVLKCVEELNELAQVLCKLNSADTGGVTYKKIVEEIADVEIMIQQVKIILDISDDDIAATKNYKIMRTAKRYLGGTDNE